MSLSLAPRPTPAPILSAPPLKDSGRPLDQATRTSFETGFGRDFAHVRVHDDSHAHEAARSLGARAYAAGPDLVFGQGQYQPETAMGRALIAHELAHSVQQAGVAMKADGPTPAASDPKLEAEADRAAFDVMAGRSAPTLSQVNKPVVFRAATTSPAPAAPVAGPAPNMPAGFSADAASPAVPGANDVTVWLDMFALPEPKGSGDWVQKAYDTVASGGGLGVILLANGSGAGAWDSPAAWKEDSRTAEYLGAWLSRGGFSSVQDLGTRVLAAAKPAKKGATPTITLDNDTETLAKNLKTGLSGAHCDVDHIVEKQMGGTSQPANLQLLTSTVNQHSGRQAYLALKTQAEVFRKSSADWKNVRRLAIRIKAAKVPAGVEDASVKFERMLRANPDLGDAKKKAAAATTPLQLSAAGRSETITVAAKGDSGVDDAERIIPGVRLETYRRSKVAGAHDTVLGELDNRAMAKSQTKGSAAIAFSAEVRAAGPAPSAAPATADAGPDATTAGVEHRDLKLDKTKFKKLGFFYPYLSPGTINTIDQDAKGGLIGTGTIDPSVKFLGLLDIAFGPDELRLTKKIDIAAMNASAVMKPLAPVFRFTSGNFDIDLMKFVPSGTVAFSMGAAATPILTGEVTASVDGGAFVAKGKLKAGKIPGITAGDGEVTYNSTTGWEGSIHASTSAIKGANCDVTIGFKAAGEKPAFYGRGAITTNVRGAELKLLAAWHGAGIAYAGSVTVHKPLPMIDQVLLEGTYANAVLKLHGTVKNFTFKNKFAGDLAVTYTRKDGDAEGRFSGSVEARTIDKDKMEGSLHLSLADDGSMSGKGQIAYQLTKDIRPLLGIEMTADKPHPRLRVFGTVDIATIPLTREWPKPGGERKEILKGVGVKVSIPVAPVPGLSVFFAARGSLGIGYGIGPLALNAIKLNAEVWPLEDDPKIKARLSGQLSAPGFAALYGTFGARLGGEFAGGAVGLAGGIDITPTLRLKMDAGIGVDAEYGANGFAFEAQAAVTAAMDAMIAFELKAEVYAAYGALSHTWTHPLNDPKPKRIGPEMKVTLGKIGYSRDKGITWPSLDQIDYSPKEFDPMQIVNDLLSETKPPAQ
jgi:hypothetical protein